MILMIMPISLVKKPIQNTITKITPPCIDYRSNVLILLQKFTRKKYLKEQMKNRILKQNI